MKVITANPTGLCFGVKRAITTLEQELLRSREVYSLGSPIHNPQEVARLAQMGLIVVETPEEVPDGAVSFVRAHGVRPEILEALRSKSSKMVDGTCPFVKTAQEKAKSLSQEGYIVIILGNAAHPEVHGIMGYASGEIHVLASAEEIPPSLKGKRCGLLSQTTQRVETFSALAGALVSVSPELKVYNTICGATLARQRSICRLAEEVDGIIILGGKNSANTRKLAEIASLSGKPSSWVEHADELDWGWLKNKETVGIAAGGSTPDWLIEQLVRKLHKM